MPYNNEILGYMLEHELKVLESLALRVPENGTVVEVGSFFGRSAACWAMTLPKANIYCIDNYYDGFDWICDIEVPDIYAAQNKNPRFNQVYNLKQEFEKNTKDLPNITAIQGYSPNVEYNGGDIDLFFLDAGHTNPSDWDNLCHWVPLVKKGGIICGHDYEYKYPAVVQNVKRLELCLNKPAMLHFKTSIWSFQLDETVTTEQLRMYDYV